MTTCHCLSSRQHHGRKHATQRGTAFDSHYGTAPITAGTQSGSGYAGTVVTGMGKTGAQVTAPPGTGVMFVEINYEYDPVVSSSAMFIQSRSGSDASALEGTRERRTT